MLSCRFRSAAVALGSRPLGFIGPGQLVAEKAAETFFRIGGEAMGKCAIALPRALACGETEARALRLALFESRRVELRHQVVEGSTHTRQQGNLVQADIIHRLDQRRLAPEE